MEWAGRFITKWRAEEDDAAENRWRKRGTEAKSSAMDMDVKIQIPPTTAKAKTGKSSVVALTAIKTTKLVRFGSEPGQPR